MGILGLGRKKKAQEVAPEPEVVKQRSGPALMLLVPEVGGSTSFQALSFDDTREAAEYLSTLIPAAVPRIHAFWAMMQKPGEASEGGEAMVLIRAADGGDLMNVVSFVDIESAVSFARFEVKRGLDLGSLIIWWAAVVTISQTDEGIQLTPEEAPAITPGMLASAPAPSALSPSLEKARQWQEQEKIRLQAELEEIRQRQAQTDELHKRQAQIDDNRKQLALAEKARRQKKAEEQKRFQAEAAEIAKLRAEAEELRQRQAEAEQHERQEAQERRVQVELDRMERLEAEAAEKQRLQAELEEIEREQAKAEERERNETVERSQRAEAEETRRRAAAVEMMRLQAEAEEQASQLAEELRLLAEEETGRRHAEAEAKPRLQAEAEQTKLLQAELREIKRRQGEAEGRWREEADERRLRADAEEEKRRLVEDEKRRLEAEEAKRMQAELAEISRQRAEVAERSLRTDEDERQHQAEAERVGRLQVGLEEIKRQQAEAEERWRQETEKRRLQGEAEEQKRREVEDDKRRLEAEETRAIQAKLNEIRHRLGDAQRAVPPAEPSSQPPTEREGGPTTNWVRKEPAQADAPASAEEPAREFSLQPEMGAPALTPEREEPQQFVAAEPEATAFEERPVREFSLQPEVEVAHEAADAMESPPEPGDPAAATDLPIEGPTSARLEEAREQFSPPAEDYAEQAEGQLAAEEVTIEADAASEANAENLGTANEPETPLWATETSAIAGGPADVVEKASEDAVVPVGDGAEDWVSTEAPALEVAAEVAATEEYSFEDEEPLVADAPDFLREGGGDDDVAEPGEPPSAPANYEIEADGQRYASDAPDDDSEAHQYEVTLEATTAEPEAMPVEEAPGEERWPEPEIPIEEAVPVGANGASSNGFHDPASADEPPETIPGEEDLSPEMAAFLKSRRRITKDNPFKGFDSPPGRF